MNGWFLRRRGTPALHRLLLVSMILLGTARLGGAMTVVERDFAELVERAEQIVVGRVVAINPGKNERGTPLTLVTFADLTVIKGDVGRELTLELTGGATGDGQMMMIAEMPQFEIGERAVLFVRGNGRDLCPLVGVWQGRFRIVYDSALRRDVVERGDGERIAGLEGRKLRASRRSASEPVLSLADFEALIREEIAHPSSGTGLGEP